MRWHYKGRPVIECDKVLCLVEVREEHVQQSHYEIMYWHKKNNGYFSKYSDLKGILGLKDDLVIRWGYIEDDDTCTDEMLSLTAIKAAVDHVQELYDILLTDGMCCDKGYPELVGLTDLQVLKKKLTARIIYLDDQIKI